MKMHNTNTHNIHTQKFKVFTVNVNGRNNHNKRIRLFNSLKTKKIDIRLLQEIHSAKTTETKWQQEWNRMSFWNSGRTYHSAGVATLQTHHMDSTLKRRGNVESTWCVCRALYFLVKISKVKYKI